MESVFLWIGIISLSIFAISVLVGDIFDFDFLDLDGPDDWLAIPVICGFLTALGFTGWAALQYTDSLILATAAGCIISPFVAGFAGWIINKAKNMPTDATPRHEDLLGRIGKIVTPTSPDHTGEVLIKEPHTFKLTAVCPVALSVGTNVVITEVLSETKVAVMSEEAFFASPMNKGTSD